MWLLAVESAIGRQKGFVLKPACESSWDLKQAAFMFSQSQSTAVLTTLYSKQAHAVVQHTTQPLVCVTNH